MSCPYPEYRRGSPDDDDRCNNTRCPAWEDCPGADPEPAPATDPRICRECTCHGDIARRLAETERKLEEALEWQATVNTLFVRLAEGVE